jgi:hypothetical protein
MFHHYRAGWAPGTGFWVGFVFSHCVFTGLFSWRALSFVLLGRSYLTPLEAFNPGPVGSSPSPVDCSSPLVVNVGACGGGRLNRRLQRREQGKSKQICWF